MTTKPPTTFADASTIATKPIDLRQRVLVRLRRRRSSRRRSRSRGSRSCPTSAACAAASAPSRSPRSRGRSRARGSSARRRASRVAHAGTSFRVTQAPAMISSSQSSASSPSGDEQPEQRRDVARRELARVRRHRRTAGSCRPTIVTPLAYDLLARARSARSCRRSRRRGRRSPSRAASPRTASAGIELRRRPARDRGGRDHGVELRDPLLRAPPAARLLLRRQLARVAALGLLAAHAEVEERRAERLDLLGAPPAARRRPRRPRRAAAPSRSPAARRRRRRARAPSPAGSCPPRSSASGRTAAAGRRRSARPCSRRRSPARRARPSAARG